MPFGQLVIGPPGAGKSTYCAGLLQYYELEGRPACVVNLDPANDEPPYECALSVGELMDVQVRSPRCRGPSRHQPSRDRSFQAPALQHYRSVCG